MIKGENIYDILSIDRNADKKTIKHAYARLVKQYHPEEQPEEWKRIHDAYELAMKIASEQQQKVSVPVLPESQEQEQELSLTGMVNSPEQKEAPSTPLGMPEWKDVPSTPVGNSEQHQTPDEPTDMPELALSTPVETPNVQETDTEGLFGEIEELANMQREEEEKAAAEKLKSAIHEVQSLAWQNEFKTKKWKKFFAQENLYPIISQKKFLRELGDCFAYKQIDRTLYTYLDRQIEIIAEYIKEHNADLTRNQDLAAVKYAESKVGLAYKRYVNMRKDNKEKFLGKWAVPIVAAVIFIIAVYVLNKEEQRKAEELQRQAIMMEWQRELMKQQQEESQKQAQERLESNPELKEEMIQRMKKDLKSGNITREFYDFFFEYYGVDPDELEE